MLFYLYDKQLTLEIVRNDLTEANTENLINAVNMTGKK